MRSATPNFEPIAAVFEKDTAARVVLGQGSRRYIACRREPRLRCCLDSLPESRRMKDIGYLSPPVATIGGVVHAARPTRGGGRARWEVEWNKGPCLKKCEVTGNHD